MLIQVHLYINVFKYFLKVLKVDKQVMTGGKPFHRVEVLRTKEFIKEFV